MSAAFDTINHRLLLQKLQQTYGINQSLLLWLESYLSNRGVKVRVRDGESDQCSLHIGIPQGSILGPLLFILYTKSLETVVKKYGISMHFYADELQYLIDCNDKFLILYLLTEHTIAMA